jgi:hypothetical protein
MCIVVAVPFPLRQRSAVIASDQAAEAAEAEDTDPSLADAAEESVKKCEAIAERISTSVPIANDE